MYHVFLCTRISTNVLSKDFYYTLPGYDGLYPIRLNDRHECMPPHGWRGLVAQANMNILMEAIISLEKFKCALLEALLSMHHVHIDSFLHQLPAQPDVSRDINASKA